MKNHYFFILFAAFCFNCAVALAQDTTSARGIAGSTWTVCTSMTYSDTFQCVNGYTSYEFHQDGTFKEPREVVYDGQRRSYVTGKWKLRGNTLTIDEDDGKTYKAFPHVYEITWMDNNRFYATGREGPGGPVVYTFFQRVN